MPQNVIEERPDLPWREESEEARPTTAKPALATGEERERLIAENRARLAQQEAERDAEFNDIQEQRSLSEEEERRSAQAADPRITPTTTSPATEADADDRADAAARVAAEAAAADAKRRTGLLENVKHDYRVVGDSFFFRERPELLAFKVSGSKLLTSHNAPQVALSMAALAEAKGWKGISVSGHVDFRREVWLEARLRGISVVGYEPKQHDREELAARLEGQMKNTITAARAIGAVEADTRKPASAPAKAVDGQTAPKRSPPPPRGKEHAFAEAVRFLATPTTSTVRVSKAGAEVAEKMVWGRRVPVGDEERRLIVKAVAKAVAESKQASPEVVHQVLAQVEKVIDRRVANGQGIPAVPVYDTTAAPKHKEEIQPTQHSSRSR